MRRRLTIALLCLHVAGSPLWAQTGMEAISGMTGGISTSDLAKMSPEERRAAADDMMIQMGVNMGLDEAELRAASQEERERMFEQAAERMQNDLKGRMEAQFGRPFEELEAMSEDELRALLAERQSAAGQPRALLPLPPAVDGILPDGSTAVEIGVDGRMEVALSAPGGGQMIFVAADTRRRLILNRINVTLPQEFSFPLSHFDTQPAHLVFELIDPATGRVVERFRPVAGATAQN